MSDPANQAAQPVEVKPLPPEPVVENPATTVAEAPTDAVEPEPVRQLSDHQTAGQAALRNLVDDIKAETGRATPSFEDLIALGDFIIAGP